MSIIGQPETDSLSERRAELREKWKNMTPEQRQQFKEKWRRDDGASDEHGPRIRPDRPEHPERAGADDAAVTIKM